MRTMTAAALAEIALKLGTEPVIVIDIEWTEGGNVSRYGDIASPANRVIGNIQEVAGLDNVITISGVTQGTTGESAQVSVTLSDVDGSIKNVLDQTDVHKRSAWVYQWFPNLDFSDRFLLFKGQVSSPIEWHEGDRTVRLDIINQLEDAEIGFSAEEANIDFVPDDLVGVAWPLVFGTVIHVPALRMRTPFKGILQTGFGIHDFTIACKLDQINKMCCPLIFTGWRITRGPAPFFSGIVTATYAPEPGCVCRREAQIATWETEIALQSSFQKGSIEIIGGDKFPQGQLLTLDICGATVKGTFSGTTFSVSRYIHPKATELACPPSRSFLGCGVRELPEGQGGTAIANDRFNTRDDSNISGQNAVAVNPQCSGSSAGDRNNIGWDYLATFPTADFFWAEPSCEVFLAGDEEIVYVANILPSTILRVAAFRTFENGVRELVTIPASLYTSRISDFNGYMVTEIVLTQLLSRRDEGWDDDIFISQTSSVGPNTVDIIEWIIGKYTSFTTDAASFADVKTKIDNYPSSFALLDRRNVLDVLRDIAFQARCALYLRNDEFTIRYLSEEPSSDFTIIEDDVMPKTMIMTHTETEELVTKFVATWRSDLAIEEPNKTILRYNVKRYGTQEREFDFFIYNIAELVEKSATFWLIRMANTWRKLSFRTPITKLQSEVFDVASVTLPDFSPNTIKCLVEKATYDSDSKEIEFQLWTPVRSGEQSQFVFAWPSQIDVSTIWPTLEDQNLGNAGGSGPNVDVTAPSTHPLARPGAFTSVTLNTGNCNKIGQGSAFEAANSVFIDKCRPDHGDKQPSDIDDTKPTKKVPGQGETDVAVKKNPTGAPIPGTIKANDEYIKDEADKAQETIEKEDSRGGGEGSEPDNPPDNDPAGNLPCPDADEETPDCTVCVRWKEQIIDSVVGDEGITSVPGEEGIGFKGTDVGEQEMCFDSLSAAIAAREALVAAIPGMGMDVVGNQQVIPGTPVVPLSQQAAWSANMCDEPDNPAATSFCPSTENNNTDLANIAANGGLGI